MASNLLSRLLPSASDEPFETHPLTSGTQNRRYSSSTDEHHDMDIDEENLGARFEPQDLEHLLEEAASSQMTAESTPFLNRNNTTNDNHRNHERAPPGINTANRAWRPPPARHAPLDDDDDVPQSLLLEPGPSTPSANKGRRIEGLPPPVPGPSTRQTRAQWDATRQQQRLHADGQGAAAAAHTWGHAGRPGLAASSPRERALWLWANQTDLDGFLAEVYEYFVGHGISSIILRNVLMLLQTAFVVAFLTTLTWCIDYSKLSHSQKLSQVVVPQCTKKMHGFWVFALWIFTIYWLYSFQRLVRNVPRLRTMRDFYEHLLDIPDRDIQTIQWKQIVNRIMALRDHNLTTAANLSSKVRKLLDSKSRQRLDAVDIASRLMRRDNYLIALFNKEVLDVTISVPFLGNRTIFSETTHWHVNLAIMDFVFSGPNGQFNQEFLKEKNRRVLVDRLKTRLLWTGIISVVCAPFAVTFILASYLFKYFNEYHKDPSQLSTRDFTTYAQWKFREFNELPHLFHRRRNMAYRFSDIYLNQFPKDKTEQVSSFLSLVTGAFLAVLIVFTLIDSELFLNFELTPGKNALFYMTAFGAVYGVARGSSPQPDHVADPQYFLEHVIEHTRYQPASWKGRLHTDEVRAEFTQLYQPKVLIFAEEILSMVITPFLLMLRLPNQSERIVDFFREFSIVVDGMGVVCSYSVFEFKKGENNMPPTRTGGRREDADLRDGYYTDRDNKMMASYYGFIEAYAEQPQGGYNGRLQGRGASFYPPPQFPNNFGHGSNAGSHFGQPTGVDVTARATSRGPAGRNTSTRRPPRSGLYPGPSETLTSTVLDPHHQPSASTFKSSPRHGPQGRYRPMSDQAPRIEEESTLGDSWRTSRLAQGDDDEEDEAPAGNQGGVLQLLRQFSKAQAEGRGAAGVGV